MQQNVQVSLFLLCCLLLMSFVHSYVVLSAVDVLRLGGSEKKTGEDIQKEESPFMAEDGVQPRIHFRRIMRRLPTFYPVQGDMDPEFSQVHVEGVEESSQDLDVEQSPKRASAARQTLFAKVTVAELSERSPSKKANQLTSSLGVPFIKSLLPEKFQKKLLEPDAAEAVVARGVQHGRNDRHKNDGSDHHRGQRRRLEVCRSDVSRFCAGSSRDDVPRLMECLSQHESRLSFKCKAELSSCASFQCAADARRLCPMEFDSEPGSEAIEYRLDGQSDVYGQSRSFWHEKKHRVLNCLESKPRLLSNKCLTAINDRRSRHGHAPIVVAPEDYVDIDTDDDREYGRPEDSDSDEPSGDPTRQPSSQTFSSSSSSGVRQMVVVAVVCISAAFVFMAALTVVLVVQHKRRRQRQAVMEAANSLNIPPPPTDVPVTAEMSDLPYHRMDDPQSV
jgi:hypothetical protein